MLYAYVDENDNITEYADDPTPLVFNDPARTSRWLPVVTIANPSFDHATQIRNQLQDTVVGNQVNRVFTVRSKTEPERDAEAEADYEGNDTVKDIGIALAALGVVASEGAFKAAFKTRRRARRGT